MYQPTCVWLLARELPEVEQMHQVGRSRTAPEQLCIALAPRDLRRELVGPEPAERAVQGDAGAGQAVTAQQRAKGEWVLGLGQGMEMPAVQLPELLAELPDVEPDVPREAGPVRVSLLDADTAVLERHEDLCVGVRIERRLKSQLELPRVEILSLNPPGGAVGPHVAGRTDFGIQLSLVPLTPNESRPLRRVGLHLRGVRARCGRGGGSQRRQLVGRRGIPLRRRCPDASPPDLRAQAVESGLERPNLR